MPPPDVVRVTPGPGQESVWDYPRPPALEEVAESVVVVLGGVEIARSGRAWRVLETSHPPTYYLPGKCFAPGSLLPAPSAATLCEWKGSADYLTVVGGSRREDAAAWTYARPTPRFAPIRGAVALYPGRMDSVTVDGEQVRPQAGGFYGGWVTDRIVGPMKGGAGSRFW
jgi:uncharacterized protein (DUF427 family)